MNNLTGVVNNMMLRGRIRALKAKESLLGKKKPGADDIVMKAGLVAVAILVIMIWKAGVLDFAADWVSRMASESEAFWTK